MKIVTITPHRKKDTLATFVIDGLNDLGIEVIATDWGNNVKKVYTDDEVKEHAKDADYIFAIWGKSVLNGIPSPKFHLLDEIDRPEITAYIDGSEWTATGFIDTPTQLEESVKNPSRIKGHPWINEELYEKCNWYFKRLVLPEDLERKKIIPCYIGAANNYFTINEDKIESSDWIFDGKDPMSSFKEYDFYCSFGGAAGHTSTGLRAPVYNYCKNLEGYNSIVGQRFDYKTYLDKISKSYVGISSWGAGNCCMRMWEILANKTCCFIQKPFIVYPDKFIDGESCVYYETIEEFREKLDYYLNNKEECIRIGQNGYEHTKKYHTGVARVQYMLNKMSV